MRVVVLKLMLTAALVLAGCAAPAASDEDTAVAWDAVFDSSFVHEITVEFDDAAYDELVDAYAENGDKIWIEASVTIDGEMYESAGIRLKGNSSLMGLGGGGFGGRGPTGGTTDAAEPETLPWLVRLDKYVTGQSHHGVSDLVVRSNNSETALNEAVALSLLDAAGLASQSAMYVSFTVNDREPALRLVIEHPDDVWMAENFDADGALYKAEATGSYDYRGADPESYDEVFDQEAGRDNIDLTPLIEFLEFINNSDDETFNAELAERFDIDEFATYLAVQELIGNTDDIDGPGNNSYLYYDTESDMFTVVAWDHNLAFGGFGGEGFPGGEGFEGLPEGAPTFPGGDDIEGFPGGEGLPDGLDGLGGAPGNFGRGGFFGGSNVLVERFLANDDWNDLFEQRLTELGEEIIAGGTAEGILQEWVDVLASEAGDLVSETTVQQEALQIETFLSG